MGNQCIKCKKEINGLYTLCTECAKETYSENIFWISCDPLITKPVVDRFRERSEALLTIGERPESILFKKGKNVDEEIDSFDPDDEVGYKTIHEKMNSIMGEMGVYKDFDEEKYQFSKKDVRVFSKLYFKLEEFEHEYSDVDGVPSLYLRMGNLFFYTALKSDIGEFEPEFRKKIVSDLKREAEGFYRLALKTEKDDFISYKNLGKLHLNRKEYTRAKEYLHKALEIEGDLESERLLIRSLILSKELEKAEDRLNSLDKDDHYWLLKGDLSREKGGWGRAVQFYDEAIDNNEALLKKAELLLKNEEYEKSLEAYDEYLQREELDDQALKNKARCLLSLDRNEEALENIKRSISVDPHDEEKWIILGEIYENNDDAEDAKEAFQSALELNPKNEDLEKRLNNL